MSDLILSRIVLEDARALVPHLLTQADGPRTSALHRFVWSCFPSEVGTRRDFLWREDTDPRRGKVVYTLSRRIPEAEGVQIDPKPFTPELRPNARLGFILRANATETRKVEGRRPQNPKKRKITRDDVVIARMHRDGHGKGEYGEFRTETARLAAVDWLSGVGARSGFVIGEGQLETFEGDDLDVPAVTVESYSRMRIGRGPDRGPIELGVLDLSGEIIVRDAPLFLNRLACGFGRARAFGCGMMMIRRAG